MGSIFFFFFFYFNNQRYFLKLIMCLYYYFTVYSFGDPQLTAGLDSCMNSNSVYIYFFFKFHNGVITYYVLCDVTHFISTFTTPRYRMGDSISHLSLGSLAPEAVAHESWVIIKKITLGLFFQFYDSWTDLFFKYPFRYEKCSSLNL